MTHRHIFISILCFSLVFSLYAEERPIATIKKLPDSIQPTIDGEKDDVWYSAEAHEVQISFTHENPVFNENPVWRAVWNDEALYVLIEINDDEWAPSWITGLANWESDKPELYFDVNQMLHNGEGASINANGHYQIAPDYSRFQSGQSLTGTFGENQMSFYYSNSYDSKGKSIFEYKIPFSSLPDDGTNPLDPSSRYTIGFDVVVIDNTPEKTDRSRIVWSNNGSVDYENDGNIGENWHSLDDAGELFFSDDELIIEKSLNQILSFRLQGSNAVVDAEINGNKILVNAENLDDLTNLVAFFELSDSGAVFVNGVEQKSGITANDFTNPVTYSVQNSEGASVVYDVEIYSSIWSSGYPLAYGGFNSGRFCTALTQTGTVYFVVTTSQQTYTAGDIYQMFIENNNENIISGSIEITSPNEQKDIHLDNIFEEVNTYYAYFICTSKVDDIESAQVIEKEFSTHSFETVVPIGSTSAAHGFLQYLPETYFLYPEKKLPLVIFYHGIGENASGNRNDLIYRLKPNIPEGVVNNQHDHLLFAPQCHTGWWNSNNLVKTFNYIEENFNFDGNRIYVTGLSMGGAGTAMSIDAFGEKIAAAVTTASAGVISKPSFNIPVWGIHNKYDNMVPLEHTYKLVDSVLAANGDAVLTIYPDYGHDSWTESYLNDRIWDWLFAQEKGKPYQNANVVTAKEISNKLNIDGVLNEYVWQMPYIIKSNNTLKASFDCLWNEKEMLYIAVEVNDDNVVDDTDGVNIYFDTDYSMDLFNAEDRFFSFRMNNPQVTEKNGNINGVTHHWSETANGYLLEVEIPFSGFVSSDMTLGYTKGYTLGFDVEIIDNSTGSSFFCGDKNNVSTTAKYGTMSLINQINNGLTTEQPEAVMVDASSPTIDGKKDVKWTEECRVNKEWHFVQQLPNPDFSGDVYLLWDDNNLYIYGEIGDNGKVVNASNGDTDLNDHVSIMIDMDLAVTPFEPSTLYFDENDFHIKLKRESGQVEVLAFPNRNTNTISNNITCATAENNSGWSFEVEIPFDLLYDGFSPKVGSKIGFDLVVGDTDNPNSSNPDYLTLARMGNRLNRNPEYTLSYGGVYYADPSSWLQVTFVKAEIPENQILSFQLNDADGIIKEDEVIVPISVDTDLTALAATFEIPDGTQLFCNGKAQENGVTINDFSTPLKYELKSGDVVLSEYEVYIQYFVHDPYTEVTPLIKDNWSSHTWPYNAYYPKTNADHRHGVVNGHVASSCGPTAISRLIHYWEYPVTGNGSASFTDRYGCSYNADFGATAYRWNEMPYQLFPDDDESTYGPVAELVYHVGVSAMDEYVTGAFDVPYALTNFFLYADSVQQLYRKDYTREEWIAIFKNELSNKRPIIASGGTPEGGGHWFICDGYNADNEFHFLMGWNGDGDGYYDIDNPNGYSEGGDIIIGVMPKGHEFVPDFVPEVNKTQQNIVKFQNTTWQLTNQLLSWYWDFGDGNSSTDRSPDHQYNKSGDYKVTLTVTSGKRTKTINKTVVAIVEKTIGKPDSPQPENEAGIIGLNPQLSWINGEGTETVSLLFGTKNPPSEVLIDQNNKANSYQLTDLNPGTTYYWKVICKNNSLQADGEIWSFTTGKLPDVVTKPFPESGATEVSTDQLILYWMNGSYTNSIDVLFDTLNPPMSEFAENQDNINSIEIPQIENGKIYYWQIIAKNNIGETKGPVWSFSTTKATGTKTIVGNDNVFRISFNQLQSTLFIEAQKETQGAIHLSLYDLTGKLLHSESIHIISHADVRLNNSLAKGLYLICLQYGEKNEIKKLFVK